MDASRNVREGHTAPFDVLTFWHEERFFSTGQWQWRIQGRDGGGADSPLFLDQIEDRRANKIFFETAPPPLSQGVDDSPLIWRSLSATRSP